MVMDGSLLLNYYGLASQFKRSDRLVAGHPKYSPDNYSLAFTPERSWLWFGQPFVFFLRFLWQFAA